MELLTEALISSSWNLVPEALVLINTASFSYRKRTISQNCSKNTPPSPNICSYSIAINLFFHLDVSVKLPLKSKCFEHSRQFLVLKEIFTVECKPFSFSFFLFFKEPDYYEKSLLLELIKGTRLFQLLSWLKLASVIRQLIFLFLLVLMNSLGLFRKANKHRKCVLRSWHSDFRE